MHWSKDPIKKEEVKKKIKDGLAKLTEEEKILRLKKIRKSWKGRKAWNKNLPKGQQPRFGKPIGDNQRKAIIANFSIKGEEPWNKGLEEWSPRLPEQIRMRALVRDNFSCQMCKATEKLVVHHLIYYNQMEDKDRIHKLNNLITLCRSCHLTRHNTQKKILKSE